MIHLKKKEFLSLVKMEIMKLPIDDGVVGRNMIAGN